MQDEQKGVQQVLEPLSLEAAFLDGASFGQTFWRVTGPLALPSVTVAGIVAFAGYSEFAMAWLFVDRSEKVTPAMAISGLYGQSSTALSLLGALSIRMSLTVGLPFFWLRRRRLSGLLFGAVNGQVVVTLGERCYNLGNLTLRGIPGGSMYHRIVLVGNLGRDPEMKYVPNGTPVTRLSVATSRKYKASDGQLRDETLWFRVTVWGKQAETCNQYLSKGRRVLIEGDLIGDESGNPRIWVDKEGKSRASFEVRAQLVRFLDRRESSDNELGTASPTGSSEFITEDELPFS